MKPFTNLFAEAFAQLPAEEVRAVAIRHGIELRGRGRSHLYGNARRTAIVHARRTGTYKGRPTWVVRTYGKLTRRELAFVHRLAAPT